MVFLLTNFSQLYIFFKIAFKFTARLTQIDIKKRWVYQKIDLLINDLLFICFKETWSKRVLPII